MSSPLMIITVMMNLLMLGTSYVLDANFRRIHIFTTSCLAHKMDACEEKSVSNVSAL